MAKKVEVNKSEAIRGYLKEHPTASNKEVSEGLSQQGITVSTNLIATVKGNGKKRRKKAKKEVAAATTTNGGLNIAQVKAAFRFLKECGDTAAAKAALSAADELKKVAVV